MNTPSKEIIDIFTKVTKHLLTQNAKAESFNEKTQHTDCCYLTPTGLKCAIGCLIKSDCYDPAIEGCTVSILYQDAPISSKRQEAFRKVFECSQIPTSLDAIDIMISLQRIHDQANVLDWKHRLQLLAADNNIPYDWSQHG